MFDSFKQSYSKDTDLSLSSPESVPHAVVPLWDRLLEEFSGASFERGLYRVIRASDLAVWHARISIAFPDFSARVICFGYDWLGRAFAVDPGRLEHGEAGVVMFEPGTGEALEIPCGIETFHNEELTEYADAAVAKDFHIRWVKSGGVVPNYEQCIGYMKPLFLGGADEIDNLELSDLDVYWHLMSKLIQETKVLAPGTKIRLGVA